MKAVKLRGCWSEGLIEKIENVGLFFRDSYEIGQEVSEIIGVQKYITPEPQDLSAKGGLPYGIPKTDEERFNNIKGLPFGEKVNISLKKDGQSISFYCVKEDGIWKTGVCGRTMEYKLDCNNNYTKNAAQYDVLNKLLAFCVKNDKSICIRGESTGLKIQGFKHNPDAGGELKLSLFSTYLVDERKYAYKGDKFYIFDIAEELGLPTVDLIEKDVVLTPELIEKYSEDLTEINGKPFEGVVINHQNGSFKCINKHYDSLKG